MAKKPPTVKSCANCDYFVAMSATKGECYRYPPVVLVIPGTLVSLTDPQVLSKRPEVTPECFPCGEWNG